MISSFDSSEYIVTPSGSCASMFKEYPELFKDDTEWRERAEIVANKTYEFTQFIVNVLGIEDVGAVYPGRATYHTSCHMIRLLRETEASFKLLKNVEELELLPLENSYDCCGFGGTFAWH
jgi:L-lactate dehydrogenase complex protein LldE